MGVVAPGEEEEEEEEEEEKEEVTGRKAEKKMIRVTRIQETIRYNVVKFLLT